jgi:hypothetical protein
MNISTEVRAALQECKRLSDVDSCEHAIGLKPNGKRYFLVHGDKESVSAVPYRDLIKPGDTIVHSHADSLNSLSNGDLYSANHAQVNAYCITRDGSIYRANADNVPLILLEIKWWSAADYLLRRSNSIFENGNTKGIYAHWVNRILERAGYIEYEFELQPETQKLVEEIDAKIGFVAK